MGGGRVARFARVDDERAAPGPAQDQRRGEPRSAASDDDHFVLLGVLLGHG